MGKDFQESTLPTFLQLVRVRAAHREEKGLHMIKLLTGWLEMRDAWRSSAKVDCFLRSELETNFVVEEPCCDPEVAEAVV